MEIENCGAIGLQSPTCEKPLSLLERLEERKEYLAKEIVLIEEIITSLESNPDLERFVKQVRRVILY